MMIRLILVFLSIFISCQSAYSQNEILTLRHLGRSKDMPNSPITYLLKDPQGFLWIGTTSGLYRFDGYTSRCVGDMLPNSGHIGVVKKVFQDSKGNTWIMRDNHGIEKLVFDEGRYKLCPVKTEGDFIPEATIFTMIEDQNGTLIFGSYKFGLYTYNESVNKFRTLSFTNLNKTLDVNCMIASQNGSVWIGTDNAGVWLWNPADNMSFFIPDASEDTPSAITCLTSLPDNHIFIGKFAKGLYEYQNGQVRRHNTNSGIENSYIWSMDFDKTGTLWIGTLGNGVFKLLRESQLNISEIAYQTGFNNPKMFSKYFKEEFGILPSAYQSQQEVTSQSNIMDLINK